MGAMGSSSKKRQTMAKMTRERLVREKRALKAEKREAKKQAAADAQQAEATGIPIAPETVDDTGLPAA
jgi:stress response protein YsnF